MACTFDPSNVYPRVSGRLGQAIDLNITFFRNGVPSDPFNIRKVSIYKSSVAPENLVTIIPISEPGSNYPLPLSRETDTSGNPKPGVFHLYWNVPKSGIAVPDIFFDVWTFVPDNIIQVINGVTVDDPDGTDDNSDALAGTNIDLDHDLDEASQSCCQKFWLYTDGFYCDSGLENIRLGFEAIDSKFNQPEVRTLEVGMMPLPLYDFDYNKMAPLIPQLRGKFTLMTDNCETLIDAEPMSIGIRQGTYRSNPFVLHYKFDTTKVLKGSYKYQVTVCLPNGESRVSPFFNLQVS